jgi:predicted CoA-binding protein
MNEPAAILHMLGAPQGTDARQPRSLAVVGLSDNPGKASYSVSAYMQAQGYRIVPVNPAVPTVLGEVSYPSLSALPFKPDVVNVFRLPRYIPAIVDEMIALGLHDLWVQLGIVSLEAAETAEGAGIRVVMDRCILIEHRRLGIGKLPPTPAATTTMKA